VLLNVDCLFWLWIFLLFINKNCNLIFYNQPMRVTKVVKCSSPPPDQPTILPTYIPYLFAYHSCMLLYLYHYLFCHIIMMVFIHVGENHKMSKLRLEPSPPWPQSKALTIQPPFHVMKNNVIIKNINSYIFWISHIITLLFTPLQL
jgi:hypothetical protein